MALVFESFVDAAIGDASYLVGDDGAGVAAVVDPQRDVERYLAAARRHRVAIRHVVQTHVHEDFVSGALALARAADDAELDVGGDDAPAYRFAHRALHDGEKLELGNVALTVRHAPGHTPEHLALLVSKAEAPPFAVFSGGALLADAAGRTDLLGPEHTEALTRAQQRTLRDVFLALDDGVTVYPTHVHGSPCGAAIGDRPSTTIGHERRHNPLLRAQGFGAFRDALLGGVAPRPRHYPRIKARNTDEPPPHGARPSVPALPPAAFRDAVDAGDAQLVDTRDMLAFGGGHVGGALNFGAAGHLAVWAGWLLDAERPLLLVLDADTSLPAVQRELARTGFERFAGFLAGGMKAWAEAGLPTRALPQWTVDRLADALDHGATPQLLDVRAEHEWRGGRVPGARHVFLPELPHSLGTLDRARPVAVYCDSGWRASIGASWLKAAGFDAINVPGSWQAWRARGLPVDGG